jgi:hypothetical protein
MAFHCNLKLQHGASSRCQHTSSQAKVIQDLLELERHISEEHLTAQLARNGEQTVQLPSHHLLLVVSPCHACMVLDGIVKCL